MNRMAKRNSFKMGTVELIVLFLLSKGDLYGYQLANMIKDLSDGQVSITESSLYPTLYKLLENKYISDYEKVIGKRRVRVYYHIEESGLKRLEELIDDYNQITSGIHKILNSK